MRGTRTTLAMLLLAATTLPGEDSAGQPSIVRNSPFLPPGFQPPGSAGSAATPAASASQFEFRGVYKLGETYYFNLYDTRQRKASWVTRDSSAPDMPRVLRYDREDDLLVVDSGGQQLSLNLVETSDQPVPIASAQPAVRPAAPVRAAEPAEDATTTVTPARRRVIRPSVRSTTIAPAAERRPTIQPAPSNP